MSHLPAALVVVVLLASCGGGEGHAPSVREAEVSPSLALGLPTAILTPRIRPEDLVLELRVNGQGLESMRVGDSWTASLLLEGPQDVQIDVLFLSDTGIALAAASRFVAVTNQQVRVTFGRDDYFLFDDDSDGFTNIEEIDSLSDPFDRSSTPEGVAPPVDPVDVFPNDSGVVSNVIDRMGRPGISTMLIRTDEDKNAYNANGFPSTWAAEFTAPMVERLRLIDTLDGIIGNALLDPDTLAGFLVDDRLQIDTSVPECDIYLALEIGLGGCGGRTLERDVIDDTLRYLISLNFPVSDLAFMNDRPLPGEWPFLAEPFR